MLKKTLRWIALVFLIVLALSGIGIGAVLSPKRERDYDQEVRIELVEDKLESDLTPVDGMERN